jgi:hypothetical protein
LVYVFEKRNVPENLFAGFFQNGSWIPDNDLPTPGDISQKGLTNKISKDECAFLGLDMNKGSGPDEITPAILKLLAFSCQSSIEIRC